MVTEQAAECPFSLYPGPDPEGRNVYGVELCLSHTITAMNGVVLPAAGE